MAHYSTQVQLPISAPPPLVPYCLPLSCALLPTTPTTPPPHSLLHLPPGPALPHPLMVAYAAAAAALSHPQAVTGSSSDGTGYGRRQLPCNQIQRQQGKGRQVRPDWHPKHVSPFFPNLTPPLAPGQLGDAMTTLAVKSVFCHWSYYKVCQPTTGVKSPHIFYTET